MTVLVVAAAGLEALEWLEETVDLDGRDRRPRIGDGQSAFPSVLVSVEI